jgi:hypothetical protein
MTRAEKACAELERNRSSLRAAEDSGYRTYRA